MAMKLLAAVLLGWASAIAAVPLGKENPEAPPANFAQEQAAVRRRVAEALLKLGDRAGLPEEPDTYETLPKNGRWLTAAEARTAFAKTLPLLEKRRWWRIGLDPTRLEHPLREPAAVISGCAAACRAKLDGAERGLVLARDAAAFLLWAQDQGGKGLFPFPACRGGRGGKPFSAAEHLLADAERRGALDAVTRNGWIIEDLDSGGLQFDNAEAGVALLELYGVTRDTRYLNAACRAADWAVARPAVPNWNYNSFSVYLLAKAFAVTGKPAYLAAATRKARLGVIPGQLTEGPRAGRWLDPHNAKPVYHYILLRALAQLAAVMPRQDPSRAEIMAALQLGLKARNRDFAGPGACDTNKALEALLLTCRELSSEKALVRESLSAEALDALGAWVSGQALRGKVPLGPREWGLFLEEAAR